MNNVNYEESADMIKILAESNRLKIMQLLSCKELCSTEILRELDIVQSTLSHHMKILSESGLVHIRKDGKFSYYSINRQRLEEYRIMIDTIVFNKTI